MGAGFQWLWASGGDLIRLTLLVLGEKAVMQLVRVLEDLALLSARSEQILAAKIRWRKA